MKIKIPIIILVAMTAWATVIQAGAAFKGLPKATDLRADSRLAQRTQRPIMVFFASAYCGYCDLVAELYLRPMLESGSHEDRILLRVVQTDDSAGRMIGFDGRRTYHADFASRHAASLTPLIKFYGPDGRELVPEIFGYNNPDYWGYYLEEAINLAVKKLRASS
ncbi:MAG: thioredoxin family protein [Gammaproteobacteria bacterium]|nr:thioredoxin family protein [Gammaproteobacteria bacterium]